MKLSRRLHSRFNRVTNATEQHWCFGVLPVLLRVYIHLWHRPVNCDHMGYGIHSSLRLVIETNIGVSILHINLSSRYRTCSQVSLTALLNILYNYVALTFF